MTCLDPSPNAEIKLKTYVGSNDDDSLAMQVNIVPHLA